MILHQVESLAAAGVTDIVLAVNYRPDVMISVLQKVTSISLLTETHSLYQPRTDMTARDSMRSNTMSRSHSLLRPNL